MNSKKEIKTLSECKNSDDLAKYARTKAQRHNKYKKYFSFNFAGLREGYFELYDGCNWDDICDKYNLNININKIFATCFCCQESEDYSLWMAYGKGEKGIENSLLLDIPRSKIIDIVKNRTRVELSDCSNKRITLKNDEYDLYLIDVIYKTQKIDNRYIHRNEYETLDIKVDKNKGYFIKNYAYVNEKECRLVLEIKNKKYKNSKYHKAIIHFSKTIIDENDIIAWDNSKKEYKYFRRSAVAENTKKDCSNPTCHRK